MENLLNRLAKVAFAGLGVFWLLLFSIEVVGETRLFLDPKFDGFWDEVEAYHLHPERRKPLGDLSRRYGSGPVLHYMMSPGLSAAYLPSDRAAFVNVAAYALTVEGRNPTLLPFVWGFMLVIMYAPMIFAARQTQRLASWCVCRSRAARKARQLYFLAIWRGWLRCIPLAFGVSSVFALLNALARTSPELQQRGISVLEMAGWMVVLAHFASLWIELFIYALDTGLLALGFNPHHSFWSEVIAVAAFTPVLLLVYQNSWLTIAMTATVAVSSGVLMKWFVFRRRTASREVLVPNSAPRPSTTEGVPPSAT